MNEEEFKKQLGIIIDCQCQEDCPANELSIQSCQVDRILALFKEEGYVKLDKDQRLPKSNYGVRVFGEKNHGYREGMNDMGRNILKAGFRKVVQDGW